MNYKTERTQTADLTKGYYFGNQSLVALKENPLAKATKIAGLKDGFFGAQVGTTSLDTISHRHRADEARPGLRHQRLAVTALKASRSTGSWSTCRRPTT